MQALKGEMVDEAKMIHSDMAKDTKNIHMNMATMNKDIIHEAIAYANQVKTEVATSLSKQLTNLKAMIMAKTAVIEFPTTSSILALENTMDMTN